MAEGSFTKLFSSITASTIWCEPNHVRIVWITMLSMADQHGNVAASIPGLAAIARVSVEECRQSIKLFLAPDTDSRTKAHEGRRIAEIEGGWNMLNYTFYREKMDKENRREYQADWVKNKRNANTTVDKCRQVLTQAEAEAEAELKSNGLKIAPFEETWKVYPKRAGNNPKQDALKAWTARRKAGATAEEMHAGTERYAKFCAATDKINTETVLRASTFFGPAKPYEQDFSPPQTDRHKRRCK